MTTPTFASYEEYENGNAIIVTLSNGRELGFTQKANPAKWAQFVTIFARAESNHPHAAQYLKAANILIEAALKAA